MLRRRTMPALSATTVAVAFALSIGTLGAAPPAFAASKGNCTAYASVASGGRNTWKLMYAGSSSGWSPSGNLSISVSGTYNGISLSTLHSSKTGTSVSTPPASRTVTAPSVTLKVSVRATGPAGTVTCSKTATS